ncbi:MAG: ribose-5-phosphate isomerase RpiA [Rhodomicrobium sp.]
MSGELEEYKRQAAARALELVEPGMVVGLGTGSTAAAFVKLLGERIKQEAMSLRCVATSEQTRQLAERCGIAISDFNSIPEVDLTVDGADEIDPELNLIKGGGGALLREKIVAMASERVCIIADSSKRVEVLGTFPLPIEIVDFGLAATILMVEAAAENADCKGDISVRRDRRGEPFRTDSGHLILDCAFGVIPDSEFLAEMLPIIPGVVDHGLFIGLADQAILAGPEGVTVLHAHDPGLNRSPELCGSRG